MYDCAIIGTGPAGVSAALTLQALQKNFIWFGSRGLSAKVGSAAVINNYPGLSRVSGAEMCRAFLRQVDDMGIDITEKRVTGIYPMEDYYAIVCEQELFQARTVILATGVASSKPIAGEEAFLGRGVSYCATCDGALYRGKRIGVVSDWRGFEHEIEFLASLAEKVTVVPLYRGAEFRAPNIEVVYGAPEALKGGNRAEKLMLAKGEIEADGFFLLKQSFSPQTLLPGLKTEAGYVSVDRACATNLRGVFAAGDITGRPYQYAKAVGEGNVAAHSVILCLAESESEAETEMKSESETVQAG